MHQPSYKLANCIQKETRLIDLNVFITTMKRVSFNIRAVDLFFHEKLKMKNIYKFSSQYKFLYAVPQQRVADVFERG